MPSHLPTWLMTPMRGESRKIHAMPLTTDGMIRGIITIMGIASRQRMSVRSARNARTPPMHMARIMEPTANHSELSSIRKVAGLL